MAQPRADVLPVTGPGGLPCHLGLAPRMAYCLDDWPLGKGCVSFSDQFLGILLWGYSPGVRSLPGPSLRAQLVGYMFRDLGF